MVLSISWRQKNPERAAERDFQYNNKERGFIINSITTIFKPSRNKNRKKRWRPKMTKKEIWEEFFLHVQLMKDMYPRSDGRLCRYCHQPWTYLTRKKKTGSKRGKRGPTHPTNFAIDRFSTNLTYQKGNIILCCGACNDRKHDSDPTDWKNFLRVEQERNDLE
tara:strand:- start:29 stop:517 length:489 start_codon:yes stop_codon:yes gene_type:complete